MRLGFLIALVLLASAEARAGLSQADLAAVAADPPPGAHLDLQLAAPDITGAVKTLGDILAGRPAFVVFVDYTCNTLCGTELQLLGAALDRSRLNLASYRILVLGIDPKDPPAAARAMEERELPATLHPVASLLLPDQATLAKATAALGFHDAYDADTNQFAHPAVVYVIAPDGALRGTLSPFALTAADIATTLDAAARGPSLYTRIRLLCYAYAAVAGVYSARIGLILKIAGVSAVVLLAGAMVLLTRIAGRAR